ncbi:hypothetical protein [Mycobacteroides abscessus]|uniref:hypothetical protein n=1 Tax=Mycobacteroides abscessus TaxID=36809 RepID=UPI000241CFC4|nr:hypothetical protein [Mycobacteroides abscessus]EHM22055.1 hypothetical protein MBOL_09570 [Mycobacteroides abscessus subsp. bolletii BD]ORA29428.1 hypothetical protein BST18_06135 [Mycobacteroides abscessus subsp. bolletii]TPF65656.1 hypothetical protein XW60_24115 [Mycobacteroides abscessus subsp. bolletii]BBB40445.1 hypothetical protein MASB_10110 [Mycobacteroides abscessus subsp. bolletii BD]
MTAIDTEDLVEDVVGDDDGAASENADSKSKSEDSERDSAKARRQMTFSLRAVVVAAVICLLAVAVGVLGWLYADVRGQLDTATRQAGDSEQAEGIAADYAVNAAEMDYQDFNAWKVKLVKGTSPELKEKLGKAADSMEQVLTPMQWKSTAKPLATKTRSNAGGVYVVDSFVSVLTKTMQTPEGLQSTATYSITIDSNNSWQITDVGGIDSALGK